MADGNSLGEILGAVLTAVAHARRLADEETVAIAEYYKQNPLLAGMSVPRIRIPQFDVDIPVVIDRFKGATRGKAASPEDVSAAVTESLRKEADRLDDEDPNALALTFEPVFRERLTSVLSREGSRAPSLAAEEVSRVAEESLIKALGHDRADRLDREKLAHIIGGVRAEAAKAAIIRPSIPPQMTVSVVTSNIKDLADPNSVTRIHLSIREDGVEWSTTERPDGTTRGHLIPE